MALTSVREVMDAVNRNRGKRCFLYFIASPDETGESWCGDCRKAQCFVDSARKQLPLGAVFLTVHTGSRPEWKNPNNEFRLAPGLNITNVPTLLEFGRPTRLVESQLLDVNAIISALTIIPICIQEQL